MNLNTHLIFTTEFDRSTEKVMDWLHFYNQTVERKNAQTIVNEKQTVTLKSETIPYKSIWYRKVLGIQYKEWINAQDLANAIFEQHRISFNTAIEREVKALNDYFYTKFHSKKTLCNYHKMNLNKLETLKKAIEFHVDVPETLICSDKKTLIKFIESSSNGVINKSIDTHLFYDVATTNNSRQSMVNYTEEITPEILNKLPDEFLPSLFQEKLNKEYEIRSFYLDGAFYSMAIFSQNNAKTNVDFRRYDKENPNRKIPYKLPKDVEIQLDKLMRELQLNTGSIDIVKTVDNRFVFLEVNPAGQYGMTSFPCNYYLDKKIARFLIGDDQY